MLIHVTRLSLIVAALIIPASISACGGDDDAVDADPFDTFQACFDDHHGEEGFTVDHAITICCLDHPIGTNAAGVVCGAAETDCETYVGANLAGSDATGSDITTACTDYITQKSQ